MKRGKKVNTLGLIQKMAEQNKETVNVLKTLKSERSIEETPSGSKQHFEPKTVRNTKETAVIENHKGMTSKNSSMTDEYHMENGLREKLIEMSNRKVSAEQASLLRKSVYAFSSLLGGDYKEEDVFNGFKDEFTDYSKYKSLFI